MTALSSPKRKDGLLLERVSYGTSGHWDTEHNDQNRGWSENLQTIEDLQLYFTAQLSQCRQQAHKPLQQGRGRLFSRDTDKHRKGTADPWITQVWTAGLHLQADFLQQKTLQYYSIHRQLNPWIQRNHRYTEDAAKSLQSGPTLCDPIDGSPPGSPVPGILQARTLEWVAVSLSNALKWKVKVKSLSRVRLLATHGLQPTRLLQPWDFPGKSTGVGCHCLLHRAYYNLYKDFRLYRGLVPLTPILLKSLL